MNKRLLGVNIIHVLSDNAYFQNLKQYSFYSKSTASEFSISFIRIDDNDALSIIEYLQLVKHQRNENTVVYQCKEQIRHDKIWKLREEELRKQNLKSN